MSMRGAPSSLLVAVSALLAGCLGGRSGGDDPSPPDTGTVVGDVLNDLASPISGASVRVLVTDGNATTDASGSFRIDDVPAGPVKLLATKAGYSTSTRTGVLDAGTVLRVSFSLAEVPTVDPRHETKTENGVVSCGLPQGSDCSHLTGVANNTHHFAVEPNLEGMVIELVWTPTATGTSQELALDVLAATPDACGDKYEGTQGTSTLRLEVLEGLPISGGHQCIVVRAASDDVVVQQAYTVHASLFYYAPPPPGFSFVE